jgi:FtsZ-binding cell division protein ZapB
VNPDHYTTITKHGQMLLDNRNLFNSKIAYHTLTGFAHSQLKNMGSIFNEQEDENMQLKAGYNRFMLEVSDIIAEQRNYRDNGDSRYDSGYLNAMIELKSHAEFQDKNTKSAPSTGRMGAKRKAIRDEYGFDTKFMYHTIRLMRMAVEFLKEPENGLKVERKDAQYLIDIRNGVYSKEHLKAEADELFAKAKELVKITDLPDKPGYEKINELMVQIIKENI